MSDGITLACISRRDGSAADGIHLLWTPPLGSGHSIGGFDIFRRTAQRTELACHGLTQAELAQLHSRFEVMIPGARIGVRRAAVPKALAQPTPGAVPSQSLSVDFLGLALGRARNPLERGGMSFQQGAAGAPVPRTQQIAEADGQTGIRLAARMLVSLPRNTVAARIMLHAAAGDVAIEGVGPQGGRLRARSLRAKAPRFAAAIEAPGGIAQIVVTVKRGAPLLTGVEIETRDESPPQAPPLDPAPAAGASLPGISVSTGPPACICYEVDFHAPHEVVQVTIRVTLALAIALRGGKAVASRLLFNADGNLTVRFETAVDQVKLYVFAAAGGLTVCADAPGKPEDEEWRDAELIAKGVDFPIVAFQPGLGGGAGELALAKSRLLPGEGIDGAKFGDVARLLNEAAESNARQPPMVMTLLDRETIDDPFAELPPWPFALSLALDAAWRRVLGLGFLDPGAGLTPGDVYDYRIVGRFRRRDAEERLFGFQDVPIGTDLPSPIHIRSVQMRPHGTATVGLGPSTGQDALHRVGRKGIRLTAAPDVRSLSIGFDQPVSRLALDLDPEATQTLSFEARPSGFLIGASGALFAGVLPKQERVELVFPEPIDRLRLKGSGFFLGVRLLDHPDDTGPDEIVTRSAFALGIRYEATLPPPPPLLVETINLQQPITGGQAQNPVAQSYKEIGFVVRWAPPEESGAPATPLPWPDDLAAQPPTATAGFHIERRRIDTGEAFAEMDGQTPPTLFVGNRGAPAAPPTLRAGSDLAMLYGSGAIAAAPADRLMEVDDVLVQAEAIRALPGSLHQYRIFSVDAIGRRSTAARLGPQVRLEKHRPPPCPRGNTGERPPLSPLGVSARLLQAIDPDLTDADRTVLADSETAILVEWGWTDEERGQDPFAKEFRVYLEPAPHDIVGGSFTSAAVASGAGFEIQAKLDRPLAADAMRGRYLDAGGYPFKVAAHGAGGSIAVTLDAALLEPGAIPGQGVFSFLPTLDGAELRPGRWTNRVAVVPITAASDYSFVIRDPVQIDAGHPRARVWVGVSCADGESYVDDEIGPAAPNGGRAGNESSIAAVAVEGRYLGRPDYTPPPPLAAVPETVTAEPAGNAVMHALDLGQQLAAIPVPSGQRVAIERASTSDIAPLLRAGSDDRIHLALPDGTATSFVPANPQDHADLLRQIRSGNPALIEGRFYLFVLQQFASSLGSLWQDLGEPVPPTGSFVRSLPDKPERYFHRIRVADAAGRLSRAGAILPIIVRVPSMRVPGSPEVTLAARPGGVDAKVRVRAAYDLTHVLLFAQATPTPASAEALRAAELLRLPNRRDLAIEDGVRLRLADGTILKATSVASLDGAAAAPPDALLDIAVPVPPGQHAAIWCVSLTQDRIPSPPSGPHLFPERR